MSSFFDLTNTPLQVKQGGEGRERKERKDPTPKRQRGVGVVDMGEPNLAGHPVWAVLSKAQRR